jgi:membrane-bound serine protease (ClpP class)
LFLFYPVGGVNRYTILAVLALAASAAGQQPRVVAVSVDSVVHPITAQVISHAIEQAQREHASVLLVRLNTPGGMLDATREIIEKLVASPVPVVTFVTPSGGRAASAGFFLLEAGDVAAMADGTNTGAASPVTLGQPLDPVMRRKIENDTSAGLRSLVAKRGRNVELAEKTVSEARSFTEKEALDAKLIDLVARDEADLLAKLDGREITRFDGRKEVLKTAGAKVEDYQPTLRERIFIALSDPNIAFLLLVLGLLSMYVEFTNPGLVAPGVVGAIAVVLGLAAISVLPLHWTGVALLLIALALFILEAKFTSHGILGVGGAIAMVLGTVLLVEGPPEARIHLTTALAVSLPFAAITIFLATLAFRARANKVVTGREALIGAVAQAQTPLSPEGKVFINGEYWNAISSHPVETGARVRIVSMEGFTLRVEPTEN